MNRILFGLFCLVCMIVAIVWCDSPAMAQTCGPNGCTVTATLSAEVQATPVSRPVGKAVKGAALGAGKLAKGAMKLAATPIKFIANKKPVRKAVAAVLPGRRCRE